MTDTDIPQIYRCPMRSELAGIDHAIQAERAFSDGIVAIGWGLVDEPPTTLEETCRRAAETWDSRAAGTIRRFAEAPEGSLVWSRHTDGTWMLGRIAGPWEPDFSPAAIKTDMHQVRKCDWAPTRLLSERVPGKVIISFSYPGSSFSQIHNAAARLISHSLYGALTGQPVEVDPPSPETTLRELLDPFDVEDLLFTYLQVERGFVVLPKSRRVNNQTYEWALIDRESGRLVPVSVKTGASVLDVGQLASTAEAEGMAIAYSSEGLYEGDDRGRVEYITNSQLLEFVESSPHLLPPRVAEWMKLAS